MSVKCESVILIFNVKSVVSGYGEFERHTLITIIDVVALLLTGKTGD